MAWPRCPGGARRLAVARLPRKTAPTETPPTTVPARNRAIPAWERAATIRASAARNRPSPAITTRRLLNRDSRTWVRAPTASSRNTTAPWTAWLVWCSTSAEEGGRQRGEQPEQGEGGEPGHAGGDELAPALFGDAEAGEAHGGPQARAHRLGNEEQAHACGRQHRQVHLEHQDGGVRRVLGEEPGDEGAEAEAAHVHGRGHQ